MAGPERAFRFAERRHQGTHHARTCPPARRITIEPLIRTDRRLGLKDFDPCTILLNNDLSAGIPGILEDINEQYLLPPLHAGWSVRRKSHHFKAYEEISKRFGKLLGIDPWLINPMFAQCGEVNFAENTGMECLTTNVDALLTKIKRKYKEYGINEKPFVVVKADNGTYGMGIMTVRDARRTCDALNRKTKHKMSTAKDGQALTEADRPGRRADQRARQRRRGRARGLHDGPLRGGRLLPRACRARRATKTSTSPGASFVPLAFADSAHLPQPGDKPGSSSAQPLLHVRRDRHAWPCWPRATSSKPTDPDAEVYE